MNKKIDEVTKMLQDGVAALFESERYAEYLRFMSGFYNYSANNCLLIFSQMPEASLVAGFNAWKQKKRNVKKGEKAIKIIAPCPHKKTVERNGAEEEIEFITYRIANVFDISQTEGDAVPEICEKLESDIEGFDSIIGKLISAADVPVEFEAIKGGALGYYSSSIGKIVVKEGMSQSQTMKTLVHEIAHSILHSKDGEESEADRRTKEVQAESVAYVVMNCLGIDTSEYSFGYIAGWSYCKEAKELLKSLEIIRKTSQRIIKAVA